MAGSGLAGLTRAALVGVTAIDLVVVSREDGFARFTGTVPHGAALGAEDLVIDAEVRAPQVVTITPITIGGTDVQAAGTSDAPIELATGLEAARAGDRVVVLASRYDQVPPLVIHDGVTIEGAALLSTDIVVDDIALEASANISGVSLIFRGTGGLHGRVHDLVMRDLRLGSTVRDALPVLNLVGDGPGASVHLDNVTWESSTGAGLRGASPEAPLRLVATHVGVSDSMIGLALTDVEATIDSLDTTTTDVGLLISGGRLRLPDGHLAGVTVGVAVFDEPREIVLGDSLFSGFVRIDLDPTLGQVCIADLRPDRAAPDGPVLDMRVILDGHELFGNVFGPGEQPPLWSIAGVNQRMELH